MGFVPRDLPHARLLCIPPVAVDMWVPIIGPFIARAYAEFGVDIPSWLGPDLREGKALAWVAIDREEQIMAVLVTSLVTRHYGKVCKMLACSGGDLDLWAQFHLEIERYAKGEGCVKVTLEGRRGWERALSGYQVKRVILEKDL